MHTKAISYLTALTSLLAVCVQAQTTAFTYQGRLSRSNSPISGTFELQFTAYDSISNGTAISSPVSVTGVLVSNGLFTTSVDLGATPFSGPDRWLEIGLRTNGTLGSFIVLRPRQQITSAPYAVRAGSVPDGAITANKLSSGVGANGQVLKMNGGILAWATDLNSGGGVVSVGTGTGLTGGPITTAGTLSIDTTVVPRLGAANTFSTGPQTMLTGGAATAGLVVRGAAGQTSNLQEWQNSGSSALASVSAAGVFGGSGAGLTGLNATSLASGTVPDARLSGNVALLNGNQTFTGSDTFNGPSTLTNVANRFVGTFSGNGAGLSNVVATTTNATSTLAGDVTGTTAASTVARIRGVNVVATAPAANQHLRFSGTDWTPAAVALASDVSGSLPVANGGTGQTTPTGGRAALGAAASGANSDITSLTGLSTPLSASQGGSGQSSYVAGDLLYASSGTSLARLADAGTGNSLISGGVGVAPSWGKIGLATHVSGTLPVASGGTGAGTALGARSALGAASSGANLDISSLGGLTIPLSANQGGSGLASYSVGDLLFASATTTLSQLADVAVGSVLISGGAGAAPSWGKVGLVTHVSGTLPVANGGSGLAAYAVGDILYASGPSTLARRAAGLDGQLLGMSGGVPGWTVANAHNHFGQNWIGSAIDGLFLQNDSTSAGASALTGSATDTTGLNYGVYGQTLSEDGIGVQGTAFGTVRQCIGVSGESTSPLGIGVYGLGSAVTGTPTGVWGETSAPSGIGVYGFGSALTGVPVGVYGETSSATGYGLYTPNRLFVGGTAFIGGHLSMQLTTRIFADTGTAAAPSVSFGANSTAGFFSPGTNIVAFGTAGTERLRIAADGKVGIGRVPVTNLFEIAGEASKNTAGGWFANSDARIKTDVRSLSHALNTIEQVRPVSFRYTQEYRELHPSIEDKEYFNVIAQEFAKVFPQSVKESGETLDGKPILQVDTHPAAMYAVAAIQELHGLVKEKELELAKLKEQNANLEKRLSALESLAATLQEKHVAGTQ